MMAVLAVLSANTMQTIDLSLLVAGGVVIVALAAKWWQSGRRDPLCGSPIRLNRLTPVWLWFCVLAQLLAWMIAGQAASWMDGTSAETLAGSASRPVAPVSSGESDVLPPDSQPIPRALTSSPATAATESNPSPKPRSTVLAANLAQVLMIAACLVLARMTFPRGWRQFGFGRRPLSKDMPWALAAWLAALLICTMLYWGSIGLWRLLWPDSVPPEHTVLTVVKDAEAGLGVRIIAIVGAVILAPVGEEIFFRGLLQSGVKKLAFVRRGSWQHRWMAIGVAAGLFGLMHTVTPQHIPALIALGMILGYAYERSGSLTLPILVHMLFNAKTLLWVALG
ncbi:MAG TPA: CPBP family intramembrane metalloprotease [Phycisphaerae bacterium]|nr:CPBP family intramembrane metalloprotease [Phycisphaerae bacterium]HRR84157.1 CPBP family intramembrane metalloprotease [Phycisphaerae bacterium]